MATITGLTAERMQEIIDSTIVDADVIGDNLILTKDDGSTIDAGSVRGPAGEDGVGGGIVKATAFPTVPVPTDGDMIVRIDQAGDPLYKYTDGVWERQPRMGAQTVPTVRASSSTLQSVPDSTNTIVSLNAEDYDTDGMHDLVTNNSRLTVKTPGTYLITAYFGFTTNTNGYRMLQLLKNGVLIPGAIQVGPGSLGAPNPHARMTISTTVKLVAGDYIELAVSQSSGAAIVASESPFVEATWLGGPGQTVDERGVPAANLRASTGQSIPNQVTTSVAFDTELFDTDGSHDNAVNNTRYVAKTAGLYSVQGRVNWGTNYSGRRFMQIMKNGSSVIADVERMSNAGASGATVSQEITANVLLAAGDYIELQVYQSIGSAYPLTQNDHTPGLDVALISSGKTVTPFSRVRRQAAYSVPHSVMSAVPMDTIESDNDTMFSAVNGRLVCKTAGVYAISGGLLISGSSSGNWRMGALAVNGVIKAEQPIGNFIASGISRCSLTTIIELAVGDYVELFAYQDSGGPLALVLTDSGAYLNTLSAVKIGAPNVGAGAPVAENGVPSAVLSRGVAQSIPNAVATVLSWPVNELDTDAMYNSAINTRLTVKTPGLYQISAFVDYNTGGGFRATSIRKNGAVTIVTNEGPATSGDLTQSPLSTLVLLAAGDYIDVTAYQNTGGALSVGTYARLTASLIAPGKTVTPYARVTRSVDQSIPTNALAILQFDVETADNDQIHDTVTNNTRLTCKTAGVYAVSASAYWGQNPTGFRNLSIKKNGSTWVSQNQAESVSAASQTTQQETTALIDLAV
jgi:hypothetical protein